MIHPNHLRILILVAGLGSLLSCGKVAPETSSVVVEEPRFNRDLKIVPQARSTRAFRPWNSKQLWVASDKRYPIGRLVGLQSDAAGAVYGLDRGSGCLVVSRERGSEEVCLLNQTSKLLIPVSEFKLDGDEGAVVAVGARRLWRRSASGNVEMVREVSDISSFALERSRLIYMPFPASDQSSSFSWLEEADYKATPHRTGPAVLENGQKHQFAVMGKFVADASRHMIYHVSDRCGLIIGLANKTDGPAVEFVRATVDDAPLPKLETRKVKGSVITAMPFGHPVVAVALGVDHGRLLVFTRQQMTAKTFKLVLDVYDGTSGDYRWSFELPAGRFTGFSAAKGRFYLQTEDTIQAWTAPS